MLIPSAWPRAPTRRECWPCRARRLAAGTKPASAADGQLVYARARLAGADLVRSGGNARHHHAVHAALRAARRAGEADAGQRRPTPCLAESYTASRRRAEPRLRAARRRQVPQRRPGDGGGRQILLRALSRHCRGLSSRSRSRRWRRPIRARCVFRLNKPWPDFLTLLLQRHRRRLDRPEEVYRERRRGRLQEGAGRRRARTSSSRSPRASNW